jgi:hypothetical protein
MDRTVYFEVHKFYVFKSNAGFSRRWFTETCLLNKPRTYPLSVSTLLLLCYIAAFICSLHVSGVFFLTYWKLRPFILFIFKNSFSNSE